MNRRNDWDVFIEYLEKTDFEDIISEDEEEEDFQPPKEIPVSLKIDTRLMMFIKRLAKDKGVSHQTLMCQWLWERVREEATRIRSVHK